MEVFLHLLKTTTEEPAPFGVVHLVTLGIVALLAIFLCVFFRNSDQKVYKRILLSIWGIMIAMDILRIIHLCCNITPENEISTTFSWSFLPFQLCDAPFYLLPMIAFLKEGKLRDALSAYIYTYVLLGGLVTLIVVSSITSRYVFTNVQTLLHHGLQVVSCIFIAVHERKRINMRCFATGILVFLCAVIFVTGYNILTHAIQPEDHVNMYFISPYEKKVSPVFNDAWMKITGIWQILFYVVGITAFSFILFMIIYGLIRLTARRGERKSPNENRA